MCIVNLFKKWETPVTECGMAENVGEEDFPDWRASGEVGQPKFGQHRKGMTFKGSSMSLQMFYKEHRVALNIPSSQVRLIDCHAPLGFHTLTESQWRKELKDMAESEVIEPSQSEWSSPIVVVKKRIY